MKLLVCFILSLQKVSHNHGLTFRQPFKYDVLKVEIFREITKRSSRKNNFLDKAHELSINY